jgi:tetratricopeptide (TPR) repeat protein
MRRFVWAALLAWLELGCGKSPQSYLARGNRLMAAGKYADAEIEYRKSVLGDPKFAEGYYQLGLVEYRLGRGRAALDALERATSLDPRNDRYGILLASVAIEGYQVMPQRKNLYQQAAQEADYLTKENPNSFDGLRLEGDVRVIDRKYDDALAAFRKADGIRPNDPDVVQPMAQVLFALNQDREGEELVRRFLDVHRDFAPAYGVLVEHYIARKRLADAEHLLQAEIAAVPKSAQARLQLARLYRDSGRSRETLQTLERIVDDRGGFPSGPLVVGDFWAESGQWNAALEQYRAGIGRPGADQGLYHKRMERALEELGKRGEARAEAEAALKIDPQDPAMRLRRAVLLRESPDAKDRRTASEELKALAMQYPQDALVRYNLALAYLDEGDTASAWQEAAKSTELQRDSVEPWLVLTELTNAPRISGKAMAVAEEALAADPGNPGARLLRAAALVQNRSYAQAESELGDLSSVRAISEEVSLESAAVAAAEKNYPKAEALYRRVYRAGSADLRPLEGMIRVCTLEKHPEKTETLLQDELKQAPESGPVRLLIAQVDAQEGQYGRALEQYRWLQAKYPKSAQIYSALGDLYRREGKMDDALANYEKASELAPNDANLLNTVAVFESDSGRAQGAIRTLDRQLALDPGNAVAMNNLAFNLAETGQNLDRALSLAESVARKFPNEPGVLDTLGWVYARRGLDQSAVQVLRGLVKKYPNEPAYRYHLAVALLHEKQTGDARREFLAALAEHPSKDLSDKIQANLVEAR